MINSKKALSEIIGYVLLIVIALSISAGVYSYLKWYVPQEGSESCPSNEVSIIINSYNCNKSQDSISLTIKNRGQFNIDGFIIYGSNSSEIMPTTPLNALNNQDINNNGRYFFNNALKPEQSNETFFSYTGLETVKRVQLEPFIFVSTTKGRKISACKSSVITQKMDNC